MDKSQFVNVSAIMEAAGQAYQEGVAHVLETLGVSQEMFSSLKKLKAEGSLVSISVSVLHNKELTLDDFIDNDFKEAKEIMTTWGYSDNEISTAAGFSPDGDALYTCSSCSSLHRKSETCPTKEGTLGVDHPVDTGDPWDHPADGNPPLK